MDFHLFADVRQSDGGKLGELRHVIYDPQTRQVPSIVVQPTGPQGAAVIVPIGVVDAADDNGVYLSLSPEAFDALQPYAFGVNVAPPPAEYDPSTHTADLDEEFVDVPNVPPVGAAEGITSIAYTPILEVQRNISADDLVIDDGTVVEALDGEIGRVEHVLVGDDTRQVTGFLVEKGALFPRSAQVPMDWVASIEGDRISLNVDRTAVEAAQHE